METCSVYIAGGIRTPFVKSLTDYQDVTTQELMTAALQALVSKMRIDGKVIGDVALGAVMNSSSNWNLSRECVLGTTLHAHTPGYTLQRACGTSLEAVSQIALKIAHKQIEHGIAGGVDTNSDLPILLKRSLAQKIIRAKSAKNFFSKFMAFLRISPSDLKLELPQVVEPRTHLSMGEHCEKMVKEWGISRIAQDEFALLSHQKSHTAYAEEFYQDLVFEFHGIKRDGIVRKDTSLEKLATLKTAFDLSSAGSLTAGNSSPLTDGAAAVFLVSEAAAKELKVPILARFVDAKVAAVDFVHGEGLLMAPTRAVSDLLTQHQLTLQDFDFYEIHEAFAGQVLCTLKAWESEEYCKRVLHRSSALGAIDPAKINVKGGSVALGHPFAATGARMVATLAKLLQKNGRGRGLISICTAGGMGVAAILEAV